ncbi:TolC family protein [Hydrogenivirga sp.]
MRVFILLFVLISAAWPLTLEEAKELALRNHIESVKSELELKRLEEKIREVKGSVLPTVVLSATYTRWDKNYVSSFVPENKYFVNLNLNQPLFDKGVWEALKLAKESRELQELVIGEVKVRLSSEVEKLFWAVLLKREVLGEKRESLRYWENYFALVREKYEEGIVPRYEFLRARAQLRQARADLIRAESDLKTSLNSFKSFLGLTEVPELEGRFRKVDLSVKDPFGVLEAKNPRLRVLRKAYRVKLANVGLRRSDYYPKLSLFFNYNFENVMDFEAGQLKEDFRHGYNFGLRLDFTIYDGSKRSARVVQEEIESRKALKELQFVKTKLRNELESLLAQLRSAEEELKAREDTLLAAEESLRFATQRYAEGVGSQVELLEARRSYEQAKLSLLNAVYNYNSLVADLKALLGM